MRRIRENMYIFSMARAYPGKIIACRSNHMDGIIGKDVFSYLGVSREEYGFFRTRGIVEGAKIIALVCEKRGVKRAVLLFGSFAAGTSLFLAVQLLFPLSDVARSLCRERTDCVELSPAMLLEAQRTDAGPRTDGEDAAEAERYLQEIMNMLKIPVKLASSYRTVDRHTLIGAAESTATFVGCLLDCSYFIAENENGEKELRMPDGRVFDGPVCSAVLLVMTAVARYYSTDRTLKLDFVEKNGVPELCFEMNCPRDGEWYAIMRELYFFTVSCHDFKFDCTYKDGKVSLSFIPVYGDVGALGVKQRIPEFRYTNDGEPVIFE